MQLTRMSPHAALIETVAPMLLLQRGAKFLAQKPYYYLVIPFFLWFIGTQYAALNFYRDPSSRYFDIRRAYDRVYTQYRTAEAASFIEQANDKPFHRNATNNPDLCVGMLTLARPSGDIYFRNAMGSLLAGLSQEERDAIHLMPFITHTDPSQHPVYGEPWLENVADKVLGYNVTKHMTEEKVNHTKELEQERERTGVPDREKHMADYTYLIRACLEHNPKYVVMLEDDVVAIDGWFHRTMAAIQEVERQTQLAGEKDFFYLRLFYTERGFGWDASSKPIYLRYAIFAFLVPNALFFLAFRRLPILRKDLPILLPTFNLTLAVLIFLYFTAGYNTTQPLAHGVRRMPQGGCCAQGIVYPASKIPLLADFYEQERIGFVDSLAEKLAGERADEAGMRWAMVPAVLQHVGSNSSKGDNWGSDKPGKMSEAEKLWNFAFELSDPVELAREHEGEAQRLREEKAGPAQ